MSKRPDNFIRFTDTVKVKVLSSKEERKQIKDYLSLPGQKQSLRVRIAATHAGLITRNNGFYLPHKMRAGVSSWTDQYAKPILVHHNSEGEPIGRVVAAQYVDLSGGLEDSWKTKVGKIKDAEVPISQILLAAFTTGALSDRECIDVADRYFINDSTILDNPNYQGLGYAELIVDITDPEAIQKVLDGRYLTGSVGASTNSAVCSVCKQDWAMEDSTCDHKPGQVYDDKKCVLIAGDLFYDEYSFVNKPADRHSKVIERNVGGIQDFIKLDNVTGEKIPEVRMVMDSKDAMMAMEQVPTSITNGHYHIATIDQNDNGVTDIVQGHSHQIENDVVLPAQGHTHVLEETEESDNNMQGSREDIKMTFKKAYELALSQDKYKDLVGLQDAVKALIDENKKITQDELFQALDQKYEIKAPEEKTVTVEDTIKAFWGDAYAELTEDDPWGPQYAEMLLLALDGLEGEALETAKKEIMDAKLSTAARKNLASSTFCGPNRSYPVPDCSHARAAMAYAKKYNESSSVLACIRSKAKRLGCPFSDQVTESQEPTVQYTPESFDNHTDADLIQLALAVKATFAERTLNCTQCNEEAFLKDKIKELETVIDSLKQGQNTEVPKLQESLDAAKKEIKYLHEDVENLTDMLTQANNDNRNQQVDRIIDLTRLSGEKVVVEEFKASLQDKTTDDLSQILKDLTEKVDTVKIADRLNTGLVQNSVGTVSDPTHITDQVKKVELTKAQLSEIQNFYTEIRMKKGQQAADSYIDTLKAKGIIPN